MKDSPQASPFCWRRREEALTGGLVPTRLFEATATRVPWCLLALFLLLAVSVFGAEVIPPAPNQYFNDYASVVSPATAARLNQTLEQFERETSNQILVAVFPTMQSSSSIEDYTVRVAQSWRAGQKSRDNGAVLFVFTQDRKMYLQVGYGLEGVLPDALCKRIIEDDIKPHFRSENFDTGLSAGVNAVLAATKGEYRGTGRTTAESLLRRGNSALPLVVILVIVVIVFLVFVASLRRTRGRFYHGGGWQTRGRRGSSWAGTNWGGGGWSGGSGGGGGGWSGGGGFSGGGGSFGGGGAGGSW